MVVIPYSKIALLLHSLRKQFKLLIPLIYLFICIFLKKICLSNKLNICMCSIIYIFFSPFGIWVCDIRERLIFFFQISKFSDDTGLKIHSFSIHLEGFVFCDWENRQFCQNSSRNSVMILYWTIPHGQKREEEKVKIQENRKEWANYSLLRKLYGSLEGSTTFRTQNSIIMWQPHFLSPDPSYCSTCQCRKKCLIEEGKLLAFWIKQWTALPNLHLVPWGKLHRCRTQRKLFITVQGSPFMHKQDIYWECVSVVHWVTENLF